MNKSVKVILISSVILIIILCFYFGIEFILRNDDIVYKKGPSENLNYYVDDLGRKIVSNPDVVNKSVTIDALNINGFIIIFDNEQSNIVGKVFNNGNTEIKSGPLFILTAYDENNVMLSKAVVQTLDIMPNAYQQFNVVTSADCSTCTRIEIEKFEESL